MPPGSKDAAGLPARKVAIAAGSGAAEAHLSRFIKGCFGGGTGACRFIG
jgi:hypothetical protein